MRFNAWGCVISTVVVISLATARHPEHQNRHPEFISGSIAKEMLCEAAEGTKFSMTYS